MKLKRNVTPIQRVGQFRGQVQVALLCINAYNLMCYTNEQFCAK